MWVAFYSGIEIAVNAVFNPSIGIALNAVFNPLIGIAVNAVFNPLNTQLNPICHLLAL